MFLLVLACTPAEPVFTPRADLAGRIRTPFGSLDSRGLQSLCAAPHVRIGTVEHVAEPTLRASGLHLQRLTLRTERTLRGPDAPTFHVDSSNGRSQFPSSGPGRYLLAFAPGEQTVLFGTIDVAPAAELPSEATLRSDLHRMCERASGWPDAPRSPPVP